MRHASRQHTLAARYLDLFGTAIDKALAPTRCPRILILDSKPLNLRAYGADDFDPLWNREERGGAVLIAVGGDDPGKRLMPWRIGLAPDETGRSWIDFLDEIDPDGPGPDWVVADGAGAIANAVARRWPNATFYSCEFHAGRALKEAARSDGIDPDHPKHAEMFRKALWSNHGWDALRALAASRPAPGLQGWCRTNDAFVRQQVALHRQFFGFPRSNAAAERILDWIDRHFGRRRRYSLRNAARLQLVLALVRAFHAGQGRPRHLRRGRQDDDAGPLARPALRLDRTPRPERPAVFDRAVDRRCPRPRSQGHGDLHGDGQGALGHRQRRGAEPGAR
jgi:hypothetical protein